VIRVTAVMLVLLGATTWAGDGVRAPDGAYARFVALITAVVWVAVVSGFLYRRRPATASTPPRAAFPAT
jgi:multisubunit Na+/H+ antiporter MnhB subunit